MKIYAFDPILPLVATRPFLAVQDSSIGDLVLDQSKTKLLSDNFPKWDKNEKVCVLNPQMFVCYGVVLDTPTLHQNASFANT